MAFQNCPIKLIELIRSYEVSQSPFREGTLVNVLLIDVCPGLCDNEIQGTMSSPSLLDMNFMTYHTDKIPAYDVYQDPISVELSPYDYEAMV